MTVVELREKLIENIHKSEDEELLGLMLDAFELPHNDKGIYEMSPEEIEAVKEGIDDLDNGRWITNEEANKRADQWLKK